MTRTMLTVKIDRSSPSISTIRLQPKYAEPSLRGRLGRVIDSHSPKTSPPCWG